MSQTVITKALKDVTAERLRQIEVEKITPEHDDQHEHGQIAGAAACYALAGLKQPAVVEVIKKLWPWELSWWKPRDTRQNLVRAAALLIAEIERIDRSSVRN